MLKSDYFLEKVIISHILDYPDRLKKLLEYGNIFIDKRIRVVFDIIKEIYEKNNYIDRALLSQELILRNIDISILDIPDLVADETTFNRDLSNLIQNTKNERLKNILQLLLKKQISINEALEKIENEVVLCNTYSENRKLSDICLEYEKKRTEKLKNIINFLDETGGIRLGELITIGARPNVGKTSYLCNILNNCINNNYSTVVFSLEEKARNLFIKLLAMRTRIEFFKIENKTCNEQEIQEIKKAIVELQNIENIYLNDLSHLKIENIIENIILMKRTKNIRVVLIDHLHLITSFKKFKSQHEELSYIVYSLKRIAKTENIIVILFAQINRESALKKDDLSQVKGSGGVEEISDILIVMKEKTDEKYENEQRIDFFVVKNRNGKKLKSALIFYKNICRFEYI